jgi:hypothetical protein
MVYYDVYFSLRFFNVINVKIKNKGVMEMVYQNKADFIPILPLSLFLSFSPPPPSYPACSHSLFRHKGFELRASRLLGRFCRLEPSHQPFFALVSF